MNKTTPRTSIKQPKVNPSYYENKSSDMESRTSPNYKHSFKEEKENIASSLKETKKNWSKSITKKPFASILMAAGVGFLLSAIFDHHPK